MEVWRTNLYLAWPRGTNRTTLQRQLDAILKARNRVAHFERLFNPSNSALVPTPVDESLIRLFGALCPEAAARVNQLGSMTPVERFLTENPAPVEVVT